MRARVRVRICRRRAVALAVSPAVGGVRCYRYCTGHCRLTIVVTIKRQVNQLDGPLD